MCPAEKVDKAHRQGEQPAADGAEHLRDLVCHFIEYGVHSE